MTFRVVFLHYHSLFHHVDQMKEDGRRLLYSLEQMSHQLNETIDAKGTNEFYVMVSH